MDNDELDKLLNQVHDEIHQTQMVDKKGRELLRDLDGDIQDLLARSGESSVQVHPSVIQRLEIAEDHFEVTHPDLTMVISRLMTFLSNAGV